MSPDERKALQRLAALWRLKGTQVQEKYSGASVALDEATAIAKTTYETCASELEEISVSTDAMNRLIQHDGTRIQTTQGRR